MGPLRQVKKEKNVTVELLHTQVFPDNVDRLLITLKYQRKHPNLFSTLFSVIRLSRCWLASQRSVPDQCAYVTTGDRARMAMKGCRKD